MALFRRALSILTSSVNNYRLATNIPNISVNVCEVDTRLTIGCIQTRGSRHKRRKTQRFRWWVPKRHKFYDEDLTWDSQEFMKEVIENKYLLPEGESPLKDQPWPRNEWTPESKRTGVIARKIGIYPMWTTSGKRLLTTVLQVLDNHVIGYYPPEEAKHHIFADFHPGMGKLVMAAEPGNPLFYTAQFLGLFKKSGVMPKKKICKFYVTPDAAIKPGTEVGVNHFRVGDYVNVYGKTRGHGFQGVVKRWGFRGGRATHGTTKNHRRPGCTGTGRRMGRIWPGKKLPGHMGCERRLVSGLKIWRINTKYNVMWVHGPSVPGHVHHYVKIYDTKAEKKTFKTPPPFPTWYPEDAKEPLPDNFHADDLHPFSAPSIVFKEDESKKVKKKVKVRASKKK